VKTRVLERNPRVAFQVDEVEAMFRWRSVVARGEFEMLSATGSEARLRTWRDALDAAREVLPETFTENDPVPFRTILFRITIVARSSRRRGGPALSAAPDCGRGGLAAATPALAAAANHSIGRACSEPFHVDHHAAQAAAHAGW
jgi:hypothetical protein